MWGAEGTSLGPGEGAACKSRSQKPEAAPEGPVCQGVGARSDGCREAQVLLWGMRGLRLPWEPKGKDRKSWCKLGTAPRHSPRVGKRNRKHGPPELIARPPPRASIPGWAVVMTLP